MLVLPSELTQTQARACLGRLVAALRSGAGEVVEVDASALTRFDSSALAVLLEFRREASALGKRFVVRGLPGRLGNLASLYGISELLASS